LRPRPRCGDCPEFSGVASDHVPGFVRTAFLSPDDPVATSDWGLGTGAPNPSSKPLAPNHLCAMPLIHEESIKVAGATKAPDYTFRIGGLSACSGQAGRRVFFAEAKKPAVNIAEDAGPRR
jgi:hypothetical protein